MATKKTYSASEGHREEAVGPQLGRAQQAPQPVEGQRDPDDHPARAPAPARSPRRPPYSASASPATTGPHLQLRPAVGRLPDQGRQRDERRDTGAEPQHRPAEELARAEGQHGHRQHRAQQQHLELGLGGHADDDAQHRQQAVVAHPDPAHQQPHQHEPLDRLDRVGREPVSGERGPQRRGLRARGQHLRAAVAAELAGDQRRHDDSSGRRDDRGHAQRDDRPRRDPVHQRGQHRDDRRLVGGAPVEVVAADGQHVHLVEPVPAAGSGGDELRHCHRGGDRPHGRPRGGRYGRRWSSGRSARAPDAQRSAIRDCTSPSCT